MLHIHTIEEQLKEIGCNFRFIGRPEIKELTKILLPDEKIIQCANGYYEAGVALVCVTDHRFLLIDKKPMFLTIEDVRFDMISEIDFSHKLFNATLKIHSTNKSVTFTSWNHARLRTLVDYLQQHVAKIRQQTGQAHARAFIEAQFESTDNQAEIGSVPLVEASVVKQRSQDQEEQLKASAAQVAIEGFSSGSQTSSMPLNNPYSRLPKLQRRRKFPKFY